MRAEIILKHDEKERLLARASRKSPAQSVLARAKRKTNQPELVTIRCDEKAAADILRLARHNGSTWRVMHTQMKRVGFVKWILKDR